MRESFIGYGSKAVYRGQRDLEGWWRLDNYLMQNALTGNIDSSGKGRSFPFDSTSDAPTSATSGRYIDSSKPLISRYDAPNLGPTGPSPYVQTASFVNFPGTISHDRGVKFPIGGATLWNSLIGSDGSKSFTLAAWVRTQGGSFADNTAPRIFDFAQDLGLFLATSNSSRRLGLIYYSKNGSGGTEQVLAGTPVNSLQGEFTGMTKRWIHVAVTANLQGTDLRSCVNQSRSVVGGEYFCHRDS